jgi:hypothetical protein
MPTLPSNLLLLRVWVLFNHSPLPLSQEDLKGYDALLDEMATWYYNKANESMERNFKDGFDRLYFLKKTLATLKGQELEARLALGKAEERVNKSKTAPNPDSVDVVLVQQHTQIHKNLQDQIKEMVHAVDAAQKASVQSLSWQEFSQYMQRLAEGMLTVRALLGTELYCELDSKQLLCCVDFLLGGSKEMCLLSEANAVSFQGGVDILKMLRLWGIQGDGGAEERDMTLDRGEVKSIENVAIYNSRAVRTIGSGLKRLKQLMV